MTYGFLLLFAFVRTISYQIWFVYIKLYYLQLFTIIAYYLNDHIMLLQYVLCNYIWHMGSQNYELLSIYLVFPINLIKLDTQRFCYSECAVYFIFQVPLCRTRWKAPFYNNQYFSCHKVYWYYWSFCRC